MEKPTHQEYDKDFYAWAIHNAQLLREGRFSEIDIENIAEEMESIGRSEKRALMNRLAVLLAHLLKWEFQADKRSHSWKYTIKEQRLRLERLLAESPSLKSELEKRINEAYEDACYIALSETLLDEKTFPKKCPYTFKQVIDKDFFPE